MYKTNPQTLEELWNICYNVSKISGEELGRVNTTVFHRYTEYIWSGGQHFQRLLLCGWAFIRPSEDYNRCGILSRSLHRLLPVLQCVIWHTDIWACSHPCSRRERSTLNKFTRKWLWHMFKFQGEFLSAVGVLCLIIILKNHYYHPLYMHFYLDCVILLHGILCFAWNPNVVGDRDHLWDNNLFLERTLVRKFYSCVNILCVYVQYYKLKGLVYCFQFHLLFVLERNSAVVSSCRSCKVWGSYIETVTFGTNEDFLLARIQILSLLRYSVSIHVSVLATWNYKSTWWTGLVNRTV